MQKISGLVAGDPNAGALGQHEPTGFIGFKLASCGGQGVQKLDPRSIHNIDFQRDAIDDAFQLDVNQTDMLSIEEAALRMTEVVGGGVTALGAGGLAGLAAYGSVGFLASASTGTAIASLSGAAATNATLAWLGGGALSAGGLGMAGGAYVLGSIEAGSVLAIGGMMLASKAEEAKHNAYSN